MQKRFAAFIVLFSISAIIPASAQVQEIADGSSAERYALRNTCF